MSQKPYDALVIGGGPGGSSAATFLARAGKRVLVLEKEHFPRFHIGESLLPYNHSLFAEMGILPKLQAAGFPDKLGAQFLLGNATRGIKLAFRDSRFARQTRAFQVERSRFDQMLLEHARSSGAEVREGWTVRRFTRQDGHVSVEAHADSGESAVLNAAFLVDASGRGNMTGNQEGLRVVHPKLKKVAVFGQFEGVGVDEGPTGTDIVIVRLANKWFWLIPLSATKVSVGCVMDQAELASSRQSSPAEVFHQIWQSSTAMRQRMQHARPVNAMQTASDFSYHNRRLAGPRLLRVGDAAGFMDPIFSAGVYLAMNSGKLAAEVVLNSLAAGDDGSPRLPLYERRVSRAMKAYWELVEAFYTTPFMELFLQPRSPFSLHDAIIALLAGELDGGWALSWRRRYFFSLVKLQRRFRLAPHVTFADPHPG